MIAQSKYCCYLDPSDCWEALQELDLTGFNSVSQQSGINIIPKIFINLLNAKVAII